MATLNNRRSFFGKIIAAIVAYTLPTPVVSCPNFDLYGPWTIGTHTYEPWEGE